jgi:hypothetical protein
MPRDYQSPIATGTLLQLKRTQNGEAGFSPKVLLFKKPNI